MCFYPVCIILRPAAALSAAARAQLGPSSWLPLLSLDLRPCRSYVRLGTALGQKRSLLITRGRHSGRRSFSR